MSEPATDAPMAGAALGPAGAAEFSGDDAAMEALVALAHSLHIDTQYYDTEGGLHHATAAGVLAAVRAMGVTIDAPAGIEAAAQQVRALQDDPFPGPIVVWDDDGVRGVIRLPARRPVRVQMTMRFEDPAADFVPAVERVFGAEPRVLDGSRAVLLGDVKLRLEAGERELWLVRRLPPALESWIEMVEVNDDIEAAVRAAKERLADV